MNAHVPQGKVTQEPAHEVEKLAYDTSERPYRGCHLRASYLKAPHEQNALIEFFHDGKCVKRFTYPAYRIYNLTAHFDEMADSYHEEVLND